MARPARARPAARPRRRPAGRDLVRPAGARPDRRRRRGAGGVPAGPGDATCARCSSRADVAPPGRLLARRPARASARLVGPRGRDGAVAGRGRPDPEREDDEPGRAGHPRLARPGAGRQRQERSPSPHAGDTGAPRPGVVHRPDGLHGRAGQRLVPAPALRRLARGVPGRRRDLCEAAKARRHDGGRRVLVRHRGQAPRPALRRRGARRAHHGRRRALGRHPGGRRGGGHPRARRRRPRCSMRPQATWCRDDRTRSSVYTTAETVLAPFAHPPRGAAGGRRRSSRASSSAAPTRCTCARRRTTSAGCAGTSPR